MGSDELAALGHEAVRVDDRTVQLTAAQRARARELALGLSDLMDRYYDQGVTTISGAPEGALDDGLAVDRERIGPLTINDRELPVELVRVTDSAAGQIWLIASSTLAQVPAFRGAITARWYDRIMPAALVERTVLDVSLAQWILLVGSFVVPFLVLGFLASATMALVRRAIKDPARERRVESSYAAIRWPAILVLALAIHLSLMLAAGLPLTFRIRYGRLGLVVGVIAVTWLVRRLLTLSFERARSMIGGRDHTSARSLILLGERLIKVLVLVLALLAILTIAGVDTKTALAGLGIGGVALALGAQKTIENFLGGVFLLSDRVLAVGDVCNISNRVGTVEDLLHILDQKQTEPSCLD